MSRRRRRGGGGRAPARQPVLHEALVDADLLYQLLENDEEQRDEPQQHELYKLTEMRATVTGKHIIEMHKRRAHDRR